MKVVHKYTGGKGLSVDYKAEKKAYDVPSICESYVNDKDEVVHILERGGEMTAAMYERLYGKPYIKGEVIAKGYKGENPDRRKL